MQLAFKGRVKLQFCNLPAQVWHVKPGLRSQAVGARACHALFAFFAVVASTGVAQGQLLNKEANNHNNSGQKPSHEFARLKIKPRGIIPTDREKSDTGKYPWKRGIVTTVFWIGERSSKHNPVPNRTSSWDSKWAKNYGGGDSPEPRQRHNYIPVSFTPNQNPFYIALPYNDVVHGKTKPEAFSVIPWFKQAFKKSGHTVCKDRWIAIRKGGRVAYAQWEDCGPFRTDHWEYVFGNARPKPNLNQGAGLDVSPAVRDYLGLNDTGTTDWRFVDFNEIPTGPWAQYGNNNTFVLQKRNTVSGPAIAKNGDTPAEPIVLRIKAQPNHNRW